MAARVRRGGLTMILGIACMAAVAAVVVVLVVWHIQQERQRIEQASPYETPTGSPVAPGGPNVAGMPIVPPVLYCLDCANSMSPGYDAAQAIVRRSVAGLPHGEKFSVQLWRGEGVMTLSPGMEAAGPDTADKVDEFLSRFGPKDMTDKPSLLRQAIQQAPAGTKSIVVLTADFGDAAGLAEAANARGVRIYAVTIGGYEAAEKALARLAEQTGGAARAFTPAAARQWVRGASHVDN